MTKALSMKTLTRAPSSTKDRRISIEIHADNYITIENRPMPVFFSNLESPATIRATVTFENDQDCQGQDVEINYNAFAIYECTLMTAFRAKVKIPHHIQKKRWTMQDLIRLSSGMIGAGKYTRTVTATIDPLWPSSGITGASAQGMGWIRYTFDAQFVKMSMGAASPILMAPPVEVWVVNSFLPSEAGLLPHQQHIPKPLTAHAAGKKIDVSVSLTIPNDTLQFLQQVPLSVRVEPFRKGCKRFGQNIVVLSAGFSIREKVVGWVKSAVSVNTEQFRDVTQIAIREGWPTNQGGWERTVSVTLPTLPEINASMKTKAMNISHSVLFTMKYKAEDDRDLKAQEVIVEVPRRNLETQDDFLPTYNTADAQAFLRSQIEDQAPHYVREKVD
ncbi:hypothetical protein BGX23_003383 [Mortierella sp. AD031]|nr:hypothetical protein BGX23_003383 [Mortierella sp. AD031]